MRHLAARQDKDKISARISLAAAMALIAAMALQGGLRGAEAQVVPACSGQSTTAGMLGCEEARYTQTLKDLQAVYAQLQRQLAPAARGRLAVAEAAWVRFRETSAAFEAATEQGGTLGPLLGVTTQADMTEQRAMELRKHLR